VVIDPKEDLVGLFFAQYMPGEMNLINQFKTLMYQAIIE
jgi:hypothetical protein